MTKNEIINYIESLKEKLKNINSEEKNYALKAFAEMSKKIDEIIKSKQKDQESENSSNIEIKDLICRPCAKLGFSQCPKKHFKCMESLSNMDIQNEISLRMVK
jgi:hypothetical protein